MFKQQQIIVWNSYRDCNLKQFCEKYLTDNWYIHQIIPTKYEQGISTYNMMECQIILNKGFN